MPKHFCLPAFLTLLAIPAVYGTTAYVAGASREWGTVDLSSGVFTNLGTSGKVLNGMVEMPNGQYLGYDANKGLDSINPANGALTLIGSGSATLDAIAVLSNGWLFGVSRATADIYSINPGTGATTVIGSTGLATAGGGDSLTSDGTQMYLTYETGNNPANLYMIDTGTGAATLIGNSGGPEFSGTGFIGGTLYAFGIDNKIYTVDTTSGVATLVNALSANISGVDAAAAVPEPSAWGLACLGLGAILMAKRRV